ncbi:hypothetical protein BDN72DRAFT_899334 [Pluteus cervinus]|uniref:Uncharacterized protein n=1 Tax=Pluteus cervinus TaxID=181527 RepID=A0ACD3ANC1_9AGAR|nr:hypothetical protein BDN72DRAFT_899334 [Pluteus cervinus]
MDKLSPEIKEIILDEFTPGDLLRFGRTNRANSLLIVDYMLSRFSVGRFLEQFFTPLHVQEFFLLLRHTDLLVTGLPLFHFLNRSVDRSRCLDLVVDDRDTIVIFPWLASIGYELYLPVDNAEWEEHEDAGSDHGDSEGGDENSVHSDDGEEIMLTNHTRSFSGAHDLVQGVIDFVKRGDKRDMFIRLAITKRTSIEVLLASKSTCAFNFISGSGIYSLYPDSTFNKRLSLVIRTDSNDSVLSSAHAFESMGFTSIEVPSILDRADHKSDFYAGETLSDGSDVIHVRYVGDTRCWRLPIPGATPSKYIVSWVLAYEGSEAHSVYTGVTPRGTSQHRD